MQSETIEVERIVTAPQAEAIDVSVVVYVDRYLENAAQMYAYVGNILKEQGKSFEFIFIDDGNGLHIHTAIEGLHEFAKNARVVRLPRFYGMSTGMMVGFRHARGRLILTLGSFLQVHPEEIRKMLQKIDEGYDFVNGWRVNRTDTRLNQWHTGAYNWLIQRLIDVNLHDTNCTLKLFRRSAVDELPLYGDNYRFLPVLAARQGFRVTEVPVNQRREINRIGVYSAGIYVRRALDLLALVFMGRFSRKPLRFFGLVGSALFFAGLAVDLYLVYVKYAWDQGIAHRPLLIMGTLFMIVGVQSFSIGLLGELILFTHAKNIKDYQIEKILE